MTRFPVFSTNRLETPRRVSTPKDGFIGTIQKAQGGWYASSKDKALLGLYRTAREAREALEASK